MKIGDLVQLSAYARKLKNYYKGRDEDVGIIIDTAWGSFYTVIWSSDGQKNINIDRRDLKYLRQKEEV